MKTFVPCLLLLVSGIVASSQNLARIDQIKDSYGSLCTYVGEVSDGLPNGVGVLHYKQDNTASFYAGYFEKGVFSGKGVLYFKSGIFLSGNWKNGLLNGKGASLSKDGVFYSGTYADGKKQGAGQLFYKDNGFLSGQFVNDQFHGRCLFISSAGKILTDNIYRENKKNGPGYQYESESKKLFEGKWANGDWQQAAPAGYSSFLKDPSFYGKSNDQQVIMSNISKDSLLQDSGFFFNRKTNIRYLGRFENGHFRDGLVTIGDSLRFYGKMNDKGADGYATVYKMKSYYSEGVFKDDFLNGANAINFNLRDTELALGYFVSGKLQGKGVFLAQDKSLYVGDFVNGKFTGSGYRLLSDGSYLKGTWQNAYPVTVSQARMAGGETLILNPGSLAEAISRLKGFYVSNYDFITGIDVPGDNQEANLDANDEVYTFSHSIFKVPGSLQNYRITDYDGGEIFQSLMLKTSDLSNAIARYTEITRSLEGLRIVTKPGTSPQTLIGALKPVDKKDPNTVSVFALEGDMEDFRIGVVLKKTDLDYRVYLVLGAKYLVEDWPFIK